MASRTSIDHVLTCGGTTTPSRMVIAALIRTTTAEMALSVIDLVKIVANERPVQSLQ